MKFNSIIIASILLISVQIAQAQPQVGMNDDCSPDNRYLAKDGYFGAVNKDVYREMEVAKSMNDSAKMNAMLKNNSALNLDAGAVVCVISQFGAYDYLLQVEIRGKAVPYWVHKDALIEVK